VAAPSGVARPAVNVGQRHEDLERLVFHCLAAQREQRLQQVVRFFPRGGQPCQLAVVPGLRVVGEQALPHFQVARHVRFAAGVEFQAGGQQQHIAVGAKHRSRRPGAGDFPRTAA